MSLRYAKVAYERYPVSGTKLCMIRSPGEQRRFLASMKEDERISDVALGYEDREFESLPSGEELEHAGTRKNCTL